MYNNHQQWDIAGVDTRVYDSGPRPGAPAIVFVHGGDPRSLANALDWHTVWEPDALHARLVAYDKPGQGYTYRKGMQAETMAAAGLSSHLAAIVSRLGADRLVLVGHSRGALPAAEIALRMPERIAGLVLVSSNTLAPPSPQTPDDFYPRAYADPIDGPTDDFIRREPEMNSYDPAHVTADFVARRAEAALSNDWWDDVDHRLTVYEEVVEPSLRSMRTDVLRELQTTGLAMPVLQIWGNEDVSAPLALHHQLYDIVSRRTPECWSFVINHAAHYVYRERPRQFLAVLRGFMGSLGP